MHALYMPSDSAAVEEMGQTSPRDVAQAVAAREVAVKAGNGAPQKVLGCHDLLNDTGVTVISTPENLIVA